jgi:cysteine-rich repeat protein
MCDGVDLAAHVCGDGQRLGNEQCDDGNRRDGDGCSASCQIEKGFKCLGGCTHTGDLSVTYGQCQRDTCLPLPCGFHLTDVSLNFSRGALFVETPRFVVKTIIQDTPLPCQDNILRITLTTNVPIPTCIRTTRSVDQQAENTPWLTQRRELTNLCVRSRITISGLTGITNEESPYGDEDTDPVLGDPSRIRLRTMGALVEETGPLDYFGLCYSFTKEREDMGYCDEAVLGTQFCLRPHTL